MPAFLLSKLVKRLTNPNNIRIAINLPQIPCIKSL